MLAYTSRTISETPVILHTRFVYACKWPCNVHETALEKNRFGRVSIHSSICSNIIFFFFLQLYSKNVIVFSLLNPCISWISLRMNHDLFISAYKCKRAQTRHEASEEKGSFGQITDKKTSFVWTIEQTTDRKKVFCVNYRTLVQHFYPQGW